jgi:hypothetical protein
LVLISWSLAHLGQLGAATVQCQHSLNLFRDLQDGRGEAAAWDTLGLIHFRLGAPNRAVVCYEHAITRLRQVQDRRGEAFTFLSLADGHDRGENGVAARRARQQALALFELIDDPSAASVRTQLRASRDRTEPRGRDGLGVADLRPLGRAAAVT